MSTSSGTVLNLPPLWRDLLSRLGIVLFSAPALHTGHWLTSFRNPWIKAMIANLAWLIWKERCNLIFNDKLPHLDLLISRAWSLSSDYQKNSCNPLRESSKLHITHNSITIYSDASWSAASNIMCLGFIIISNSGIVLLAGCEGTSLDSPLKAKVAAINLALHWCLTLDWKPDWVFYDCPSVSQLIRDFNPCINWRLAEDLHSLKSKPKLLPDTRLFTMPREDNAIADALVIHGRHHHGLSLFFQGMDRPSWLDDLCFQHNLSFKS